MRTFATLSAAALVALGTLTTTGAEARDGGAIAAGLIGGLAAGALVGAAASHAADLSYGYPPPVAYPAPAYGPPAYVIERPAPQMRTYVEEDEPVYGPRAIRHRHSGYGWRHWDDEYAPRGPHWRRW